MCAKQSITSRAVILAWLLFLFTASNAFAYDYQVTEIQPLPGYTASRAMGINNLGEVVGRFYNLNPTTGEAINRKAFVWDPTNGAYLLPTLSGECSAWDINDNGFAVGYSYNASAKQRAVLWDLHVNTIDDIGALRNPTTSVYGESSTAYGINNLDQVVGSADIPNNTNTFTPFHAFLDDTSGIGDLGTLNTTMPEWQYGYSIAYCINNNGQVVGIAQDTPWAGFIYDDTDGMRMLPKDPAHGDKEWYAVVINDSGLIGGHVIAGTNQSLPYYWPNESTAPVKITMPAGFPYGEIYGINASGQMVGIMWSSDQAGATEHAFIFDIQNGLRDLNSMIDPASGWVLHFARDINGKGQIVGYGELDGLKHGFVLSLSTNAQWRKFHADFDGDGKADILWRNKNSGVLAIWLMNGMVRTSVAYPGSAELAWEIMQAADFNGDGKADILWRNKNSGVLAIWLMNGMVRTSVAYPGSAELAWEIMQAADFNGDGKADILWRHKTTGILAMWLMNGTVRTSVAYPGSAELVWEIMQAADFDGDGKADILWRNKSTGTLCTWLMNGTTRTGVAYPATVELAWEIMQNADFDGDGKADILWRNQSTGTLCTWLMNGTTCTGVAYPGTVELSWEIQ